jgi:hypothetical protein
MAIFDRHTSESEAGITLDGVRQPNLTLRWSTTIGSIRSMRDSFLPHE